MQNYDEVLKLAAKILETSPDELDPNARLKELGLDSFTSIELLAMLEKHYKIHIPEELVPQFTTLNETKRIVEQLVSKS